MKKFFAFCGALALVGLIQTGASAAEQAAKQSGVYVAPKFVYGYTVMDKLKAGMDVVTPGVSGSVGVGSSSDDDNDDVFGGALAVGYDFSKRYDLPIRAEIEYSIFSRAEGSLSDQVKLAGGVRVPVTLDQELNIQTLFANVYYDITTGTPLTPYLGAGVGLAFIDADGDFTDSISMGGTNVPLTVDGGSKSNTNFAWNVGAGAAWAFTDNLSVDLGYRFAYLGEAKSGTMSVAAPALTNESVNISSKTENLYLHQVLLGLRYTF